MTEQSEWVRRVNQSVAGTVQEQLRELVEEARAEVERFAGSVAEHAERIEEGRHEMQRSHERLAEIQRTLDGAVAATRDQLVDVVRGALADLSASLDAERTDAKARHEEFDARMKEATEQMSAALQRVRDEVETMAERAAADRAKAAAELRAELAGAAQRMNEQFAAQSDHVLEEVTVAVGAIEERMADMEERIAGRMMRMLGQTFMQAASPETPEQTISLVEASGKAV